MKPAPSSPPNPRTKMPNPMKDEERPELPSADAGTPAPRSPVPPGAPHTPAPWSVPHFAEPEANCECGYVLTAHLMGAVCTVHCSGEGNDWQRHGDNPRLAEAVANARLISAAPELLEAIKVVLSAARRSGLEPGRGPAALSAALQLCEAAVSRALGFDEPWRLMLSQTDMSPDAFRARTDAARAGGSAGGEPARRTATPGDPQNA